MKFTYHAIPVRLLDGGGRVDEPVVFKVVRRHPDAQLPTRAHPDDAGWDVYSAESKSLAPGDRHLFDLGFALVIPPGWEVQLRPRSGLAKRKGITVLNAPGTVDAGYTGDMKAMLINHGREAFQICVGDKIAQLVFQRLPAVTLEWGTEEDLGQTARGAGGFGSTGSSG